MAPKYFTLETREQVERFAYLLNEYSKSRVQEPPDHISLVRVFDELRKRKDGGRIFTALLDLYINFHFIDEEIKSIAGTHNEQFSKGKLEGGSILDSRAKFFGKMEIHRYATSFVLRYRALWDKLMGFFVLYFAPSEYEKFLNADSRKKKFRQIAANIPELQLDYVNTLLDYIEKFDNKFRTPEAHGPGTVRKWSLTMDGLEGSPLLDLLDYSYLVSHAMRVIGGIFDPTKMPKPR
jgi:hypothetical protein